MQLLYIKEFLNVVLHSNVRLLKIHEYQYFVINRLYMVKGVNLKCFQTQGSYSHDMMKLEGFLVFFGWKMCCFRGFVLENPHGFEGLFLCDL